MKVEDDIGVCLFLYIVIYFMGETHVWKTLGGAVRSISNIYSLGYLEHCYVGFGMARPSVITF